MRRPSGRQRRLVILTLAVIAFGVALYGGSRYRDREDVAQPISGVEIHPPAPLPAQDGGEDPGSPLSATALADHWSLLMLDPHRGTQRSPALVRLLQVHNRLAAEQRVQQRLSYLYLPLQGDAAVLQAVSNLAANINGISLPPASAADAFRRFGVDPDGGDPTLYLIGPDVRLHVLFTPGEDAATIAKDLVSLIATGK